MNFVQMLNRPVQSLDTYYNHVVDRNVLRRAESLVVKKDKRGSKPGADNIRRVESLCRFEKAFGDDVLTATQLANRMNVVNSCSISKSISNYVKLGYIIKVGAIKKGGLRGGKPPMLYRWNNNCEEN